MDWQHNTPEHQGKALSKTNETGARGTEYVGLHIDPSNLSAPTINYRICLCLPSRLDIETRFWKNLFRLCLKDQNVAQLEGVLLAARLRARTVWKFDEVCSRNDSVFRMYFQCISPYFVSSVRLSMETVSSRRLESVHFECLQLATEKVTARLLTPLTPHLVNLVNLGPGWSLEAWKPGSLAWCLVILDDLSVWKMLILKDIRGKKRRNGWHMFYAL